MGSTSEDTYDVDTLSTLFSNGEFEQVITLSKDSLKKNDITAEVLQIHILALENIGDNESIIALIDELSQQNRIPDSLYFECASSALNAGDQKLCIQMMGNIPSSLEEGIPLVSMQLEIAISNSNKEQVEEILENYPELIEENISLSVKTAEFFLNTNDFESALDTIESSIINKKANLAALKLKSRILEKMYSIQKKRHKSSTLEAAKILYSKNEDVLALTLIEPWLNESHSLEIEERKFISRLLARSGTRDQYLPFREWFITRISSNHDEFRYLIETEYIIGDYFGAIELSEMYLAEFGQELKIVDIYIRALGKCGKKGEIERGVDLLINKYSLDVENQRNIIKYLIEFDAEAIANNLLENILKKNENDVEMLKIKSNIALKNSDYRSRVDLELKIMSLIGDEASGYDSLARYAFENKQFSLSLSLLEELSEITELSISMKRLLLKLQIQLERFSDASALVDEILNHAAFDIDNLIFCANSYLTLEEYDHAKSVIDQAMKIDDSNIELIELQADIAFKESDWDSSLSSNIDLLSKGILNNRILYRTLFLLYKQDSNLVANRAMKHAINQLSNSRDGQLIIAKAKFDFKQDSSFREHLKLAMMIPPLDHSTPLLISKRYLNYNRLDIAVEFLQKALLKNQTHPEVLKHANAISNLLIDLNVEMDEVRSAINHDTPLFVDALVAKAIIKKSEEFGPLEVADTKPLAVIQSHSLGLGGAERQVIFCLNALNSGKFENFSGHLLINKIPAEYEGTYFHLLENKNEVSEYEVGTEFELEDLEIEKIMQPWYDIIKHLPITSTRKRILNLFIHFHQMKPRIVHLWQDWGNIYGGMAAIMAGVPKVLMSARTLPPDKKGIIQSMRGKSFNSCYQALLKHKSTLLCHNSFAGAKEYAEWLSIEPNEMEVVYNGTDFEHLDELSLDFEVINTRRNLGIPDDAFVVGTIHRFVPEKRPWLWLEAAIKCLVATDQCPDGFRPIQIDEEGKITASSKERVLSGINPPEGNSREMHFLMVGDGIMRERIMQLIDSLGLSHRFHFPGSTHQVKGWLQVMNCFLSTSAVEGLPNVLIEAQGNSIPVITTDAGGSLETIELGLTGWCSEPDSSAIANLLFKVEKDDEWYENAKNSAGKIAREKFSISRMLSRYSEIYGGVE